MSVQVLSVVPVIPSRDVSESLGFYQDVLGFGEPFEWGRDPVEYGGVSRGSLRLHFYHEPMPGIPQNYALRLEVDEVDLIYVACEARHVVHPSGKLEDKPWGVREFSLLDPSGVCVRVYQELM